MSPLSAITWPFQLACIGVMGWKAQSWRISDSLDKVGNLMRRMGLRAIYQKPTPDLGSVAPHPSTAGAAETQE
jgi:hypothetical protein